MVEEGSGVGEIFGGREGAEADELGEEKVVLLIAGDLDLGVDLREVFEG